MTTRTSIYHLALRDDWEEALAQGEYRTSTRGMTLEGVDARQPELGGVFFSHGVS